jgi:hypothetical protein
MNSTENKEDAQDQTGAEELGEVAEAIPTEKSFAASIAVQTD